MFKQPPVQFGQFKQLESEYYADLYKVLLPLLPRTRRMLETLHLTMQGKVGGDRQQFPVHLNLLLAGHFSMA